MPKHDKYVDQIFIIRRKLDKLPFYYGIFSHTSLLLRTTNNRWFICEYGSGPGAEKNIVKLYEIEGLVDEKCTHFFLLRDNKVRHWDKDYRGHKINKPISIFAVKKIMKKEMSQRQYSVVHWNCHRAAYQVLYNILNHI